MVEQLGIWLVESTNIVEFWLVEPTKVCLVKAMVFPVVMYGYESWTIKKAEL